jgi:hypothetical protein
MNNVVICISLSILAITSWGCDRAASPSSPSTSAREIGTVDLVVNFGDDHEAIEKAIPCSVDSTVFSTLKRADLHGDLELDASGNDETAFVKGINGLTGEAKTGKYWFFYVNDQMGKLGCGSVEVDPGDQIEWRYQEQPANFDQ